MIAPGPLVPELRGRIALVADVESAGAATVYRVSDASVRRALITELLGGREEPEPLPELRASHTPRPVQIGTFGTTPSFDAAVRQFSDALKGNI